MAYAHAEVLIDAPIESVWRTMVDIDSYRRWNPFVEHIECADKPVRLGSDLTLHIHFANGKKRREIERITRLEPPSADHGVLRAALCYQFTGPIHDWNLVRGQRLQTLSATADGKTRYFTEELLTGWLAWAAPIQLVRTGFERHAAALKSYCEAQARQ